MTTRNPLLLGLAGFGKHSWDHNVPAVCASGLAEIVCVYDVDVAGARDKLRRFPTEGVAQARAWGYQVPDAAAQRFAQANLVGSFEELLASGLDGVVIATHADSHFKYTLQALQARLDVHVAKPLVTKDEDLETLVEAATRHGRLVQVGAQWTEEFHPELLATWGLGPIREIVIELLRRDGVPPKPFTENVETGGVVNDVAYHAFGWLPVTLGLTPVAVVNAVTSYGEGLPTEDAASGTVLLSDGTAEIPAHFALAWKTNKGPAQQHVARVTCEGGVGELWFPGWDRRRAPYQSTFRRWDDTPGVEFGPEPRLETEVVQSQWNNFLLAMLGRAVQRFGIEPAASIERLAHGIRRSARTGQRVDLVHP